jgi:hypothetical protein
MSVAEETRVPEATRVAEETSVPETMDVAEEANVLAERGAPDGIPVPDRTSVDEAESQEKGFSGVTVATTSRQRMYRHGCRAWGGK